MKKTIITTILFLLFSTIAIAQERDPWVGDWTSETYIDMDATEYNSTGEVKDTDFRLIIRINKQGSEYHVRAKKVKVGDSDYIVYHPKLTVVKKDNDKMWLQASEHENYSDENSDITMYYTLTLENNAIHYRFYRMHFVNYYKSNRYKDENDLDVSAWRGNNLMLYNDDW